MLAVQLLPPNQMLLAVGVGCLEPEIKLARLPREVAYLEVVLQVRPLDRSQLNKELRPNLHPRTVRVWAVIFPCYVCSHFSSFWWSTSSIERYRLASPNIRFRMLLTIFWTAPASGGLFGLSAPKPAENTSAPGMPVL